jgi:NAD(P)-dependent dehydrogenase (short-subunit alcohol dehydrogenase family)
MAISFAKAGAKLALFDLRGLDETLELVKKEGAEAKGWELDATNEEQVNRSIDEVEEQVGPIHILVNVAGVVGSRPVLLENYKNFWRTMEVNTGAVTSAITLKLILAYHFLAQSPSINEEA